MTKNQLAFVARLAREYQDKPAHILAEESKRILALGRKAQMWANKECNGEGTLLGFNPNGSANWKWDDENEAQYDKAMETVKSKVEEMGYKVSRCGGDPRGCVLQLALPSGYVDGWGREGFLVPYDG